MKFEMISSTGKILTPQGETVVANGTFASPSPNSSSVTITERWIARDYYSVPPTTYYHSADPLCFWRATDLRPDSTITSRHMEQGSPYATVSNTTSLIKTQSYMASADANLFVKPDPMAMMGFIINEQSMSSRTYINEIYDVNLLSKNFEYRLVFNSDKTEIIGGYIEATYNNSRKQLFVCWKNGTSPEQIVNDSNYVGYIINACENRSTGEVDVITHAVKLCTYNNRYIDIIWVSNYSSNPNQLYSRARVLTGTGLNQSKSSNYTSDGYGYIINDFGASLYFGKRYKGFIPQRALVDIAIDMKIRRLVINSNFTVL